MNISLFMDEIIQVSRNYIDNCNREYTRDFLNTQPFETQSSILIGPRGIGKTTILVQYLLSQVEKPISHEILYVPVDHFKIVNQSLYSIADDFQKLGGKILCLDEIHKNPDWSNILKSIQETFPKLKIIASGSSTLEVLQGTHDLSRRYLIRELEGFSFREYLELHYSFELNSYSLKEICTNHEELTYQIIDKFKEKDISILLCFKQYLQMGYYPFSVHHLENIQDFHILLEQSLHTTIESDIPAVHSKLTGISINKIKQLLAIVARLAPFKPDLNSLKKSLDISDTRTLKTYLNLLEKAGIIRSLSRPGKSLNNLDKPEKIYLDNPNISYCLGKENIDLGNLRETFFYSAVSKSCNDIFFTGKGDFALGDLTFEVGGKNKSFSQIKDIPNSYIASDNIEMGFKNKIPLWLFGFLSQ